MLYLGDRCVCIRLQRQYHRCLRGQGQHVECVPGGGLTELFCAIMLKEFAHDLALHTDHDRDTSRAARWRGIAQKLAVRFPAWLAADMRLTSDHAPGLSAVAEAMLVCAGIADIELLHL